jgi:type II restriction enzyme
MTAKIQKERYETERVMQRVPVHIAEGQKIKLSSDRQNILIKKIIKDLCSLFTPGGNLIYVGDTHLEWAYYDAEKLASLGVRIKEYSKMPDVVVHHIKRNWLVLIESATSRGPINPKRRQELKKLFAGSSAGLVFVTAFMDRHAMLKYLNDISWETEVWVAASPTHLIHFNGQRFLGPYVD